MSMSVAYEEEEKMEEMHTFPVHPILKDVFDSVTSSNDADMRIAKAMNELKDSVPTLYKNILKHRSYFKKQ
jgi:hypothetical protein